MESLEPSMSDRKDVVAKARKAWREMSDEKVKKDAETVNGVLLS